MKIALTIWNERIAPVFDVAHTVLLVTVKEATIVNQETASLPDESVEARLRWLAASGVATLVCGAISRPAYLLAGACDLTVIPFVSGTALDVVHAYMQGQLNENRYAMPGCRGMRGRCGQLSDPLGQENSIMPETMGVGAGRGGGRCVARGTGRGAGCAAAAKGGGRAKMAAAVVSHCICPKCGYAAPHRRGVPCAVQQCPDCGTALIKE